MPELILRVLGTLCIGFLGAYGAKKLRILAPFMTGSMLAVLFFSVTSRQAYFPVGAKPVIQAIAGGAVGVSIRRESLVGIKRIFKPLAFYILCVLLLPVLAAVLMRQITSISMVSALLSCAPGGIMDMTMLSYDYGANTRQVALMHMLRMIFALGIFPAITNFCVKKYARLDGCRIDEPAESALPVPRAARDVALTVAILAACGFAGYAVGVPAGILTFSMIGTAAFQIKAKRAYVPPALKRGAQVVAGAMVGAGTSVDDLKALLALLPAVLILLFEYLVLNFAVGPFISRVFRIDLATALLACAPAGISEMALIAEDLGGDQSKVAVFQVLRLAFVLLFFPFLAQFFVQ